MGATAEATRQLVRMRGRSYVAFVFTPEIPIVGWLEEIDATLARSPWHLRQTELITKERGNSQEWEPGR